jgi:hypothetical protein
MTTTITNLPRVGGNTLFQPLCSEYPMTKGKAPTEAVLAKMIKHLRYYPTTGVIRWHEPTRQMRVKHGAEAGSIRPTDGYRCVRLCDPETGRARHYRTHHIAWFLAYGYWELRDLDHIDRNPGNCRLINLRVATTALNAVNSGLYSNNTSGHRGVIERSNHTFSACLQFLGVRHRLGTYKTLEQAVVARRQGERAIYGRLCPSSDGRCRR